MRFRRCRNPPIRQAYMRFKKCKNSYVISFTGLSVSLVGVYIISHAVAQRPLMRFASKPPLMRGVLEGYLKFKKCQNPL